MIPPTVGRILWYHGAHTHPDALPHAAIVSHVHTDTGAVNLACFDQHGNHYPAARVALYQGEGDRPEAPYAEWMPYQLGQAAKAQAESSSAEEPEPAQTTTA